MGILIHSRIMQKVVINKKFATYAEMMFRFTTKQDYTIIKTNHILRNIFCEFLFVSDLSIYLEYEMDGIFNYHNILFHH